MTEEATLKIRCSPEWLRQIAALLGCTVEIGEPDAEGFVDPVFHVRPDPDAPNPDPPDIGGVDE